MTVLEIISCINMFIDNSPLEEDAPLIDLLKTVVEPENPYTTDFLIMLSQNEKIYSETDLLMHLSNLFLKHQMGLLTPLEEEETNGEEDES